jgi:hypothetical protein
MQRLIFFGVFVVSALKLETAPAEPLPEQLIASSIAMITSTGASDSTTVRASGFVWPDSHHVVTAFHVVAAANNLNVSFDDGASFKRATVTKTFRSRDLALLEIRNPPEDIRPISVSSDKPSPHSMVTAVGYPQGVATRQPLTGSVVAQGPGLAAETLGALLSSGNLRDALNNLGFPSFDEKILLLQACIQPGMSGGPVVDQKGNLVGIANGGLEKGFGEITWAIPADALEQLQQQDSVETESHRTLLSTLFGAELEAAHQNSQKIGSLRLTKLRTRTLAQLTQLNDDPLGLLRVAQDLAIQNGWIQGSRYPDPREWKFDLYRIEINSAPADSSAAVIAVPEDTQLVKASGANDVKASLEDTTLLWKARVQLVSQPAALTQRIIDFDMHLKQQSTTTPYWLLDNAFSYPIPHWWPNGFCVQRSLWKGYPPNLDPNFYPPQTSLSVVHSFYRGMLISVGTISLQHQTISPGPFLSNDPVKRQENWAKFVVATLICGFSDALATEGQPTASQNSF